MKVCSWMRTTTLTTRSMSSCNKFFWSTIPVHRKEEEQTADYHPLNSDADWSITSHITKSGRLQDPEVWGRLWLTPPNLDTILKISPLAGGYTPSEPKPLTTRTVSSRLLSASSIRPRFPCWHRLWPHSLLLLSNANFCSTALLLSSTSRHASAWSKHMTTVNLWLCSVLCSITTSAQTHQRKPLLQQTRFLDSRFEYSFVLLTVLKEDHIPLLYLKGHRILGFHPANPEQYLYQTEIANMNILSQASYLCPPWKKWHSEI